MPIDNDKNNTMEIIKFFAAVGVIMLHYKFPGIVGKVLYGLSRFAVPFFFMISGYFIYSEDSKRVLVKLPSKILHILKIWLLTDVFYGIFYFLINGCHVDYFIKEWSKWGAGRWFSFGVFQNTWLGFTWFLFAMILCYIFTFPIAKLNAWKACYPVAGILLLVNLYVGEILPFIRGEESVWFWCSNIWLLAFPFYVCGFFVRMNEEKLLSLIDGRKTIILLLAGFVINMVERALTHANQLFLSNILMTFVLFIYAIKYPHEYDKKDGFIGKICRWMIYMGGLSMYIYLLHPMIKEIVIRVREATNTNEGTINGYIATLVVLVGSLLCARIIGFVRDNCKERLLRGRRVI